MVLLGRHAHRGDFHRYTEDDHALVRDVLERVGAAHLAARRLSELSGGERQRLGLARAVLADHPVLLLDEPTEHLDPPTAQAVLDTIAKVSEGRSLVVVTHQPIPWLDEHVEVRTPGRS